MRKYKKSLFAFITLCVVVTNLLLGMSKENMSSSLLLQNVDALAAGEEGVGEYVCYGEGTVDCPNGIKVELYFNNVRIRLE